MDQDLKILAESLFEQKRKLAKKHQLINKQLKILDFYVRDINSEPPYSNKYGFYVCCNCYTNDIITTIDCNYGGALCSDCRKLESE